MNPFLIFQILIPSIQVCSCAVVLNDLKSIVLFLYAFFAYKTICRTSFLLLFYLLTKVYIFILKCPRWPHIPLELFAIFFHIKVRRQWRSFSEFMFSKLAQLAVLILAEFSFLDQLIQFSRILCAVCRN